MHGVLAIETASLIDYYGHAPRQIPTSVADWYRTHALTCAGCGEAIAATDWYSLSGLDARFHPSCAPRVAPTPPPSRKQVAWVTGRAVPFRQWSAGIVRTKRGGIASREWIEPGAFGPLKPGSVRLCLNHSRDDLPASLTFVESTTGLDFIARLYDSHDARALVRLRRMIVGCSPSYRPIASTPQPSDSADYAMNRVARAQLKEISLVLAPQRPAFGAATHATVTPL